MAQQRRRQLPLRRPTFTTTNRRLRQDLREAFNTGQVSGPAIPAGFAPFGIQAIGAKLFVTYAKQDAEAHDNVDGAGLGFVDVYDTSGQPVAAFRPGDVLNAPWGVTQAPANFGRFSATF